MLAQAASVVRVTAATAAGRAAIGIGESVAESAKRVAMAANMDAARAADKRVIAARETVGTVKVASEGWVIVEAALAAALKAMSASAVAARLEVREWAAIEAAKVAAAAAETAARLAAKMAGA